MPANKLTTEEICVIIDACSKANVLAFEFGGLKIQFQDPLVPPIMQLPDITPAKIALSSEDRALLEDARLAQLMTDDPLAYEQEMIDQQLNPRVEYAAREDD